MTERSAAGARLNRRQFFGWASTRGAGVFVAGGVLPALLAACGDDNDDAVRGAAATNTTARDAAEQARAVVGDVIEFELASDEWEGGFGFVTMRIHKGSFDGSDVYFVRTDASDRGFADAEKLVFVPKMAGLTANGLSGAAYVVDGGGADQGTVFSSQPGRDDYTPAWTLHRVTWNGEPRLLKSVADVAEAERAGAIAVDKTNIVFNAGLVKWSNGEMAVDNEKKGYLGQGQLLEAVDTSAMRATFKLGQCYPGSRYFVLDHSIPMAAEMTKTVFAPALHGGASKAGATGRTNVFMNGIEGPGPMGFQPSAFDFDAGDAAWSPYWDHYLYGWKDGATPRVLKSQTEVHAARDAGELDEFPGMPDTKGEAFTVNCPVPVLAPPTFDA